MTDECCGFFGSMVSRNILCWHCYMQLLCTMFASLHRHHLRLWSSELVSSSHPKYSARTSGPLFEQPKRQFRSRVARVFWGPGISDLRQSSKLPLCRFHVDFAGDSVCSVAEAIPKAPQKRPIPSPPPLPAGRWNSNKAKLGCTFVSPFRSLLYIGSSNISPLPSHSSHKSL